MPTPDMSKKLLNMGAGSREEGGLGAAKQNADNFEKAVGGPPDMPKANPPQAVDKIHKNGKFGDKPGEKRIDVDQMTKPLGSFKHGTTHVPKTGVYKLHEGEAVVPKKDNKMAGVFDLVKGNDSKKPAKHIKTIVHSKSHDGKHVMVHKHHHPEHHEDETHIANDMSELHKHLEDHAGTPNEGEAAAAPAAPVGGAPAGGPPAPMTATPPPMPTPGA